MARRCLVTYDGAALWVADDPLLRRQVWILHHGRDAERCAGARRAVERPSRLRWIATGEAEGRPWDAYDAPHPAPSLWACSTGERRRPWREGRRELRSLAVEIVAAREDGTLPSRLSLAQIVAGPEGRILLLDRTFEPDSHDMELFDTDPEGLRSFFQVTVCALATGHIHRSNEIARRVDVARLPVWDHELLGELWNPSHDPIETIASMPERLRDELRRGGELTVRSRITYLLGIAILSGTLWVAAPEVIPGMIEMTSQAWAEGRAAAEGMNAPPMEWARTAWSFPPWLAGLLGFLIPIVSALAFRGGLGLRLPALEVCTTRGRPAGPWRLFLRSLPLALATAAVAYTLFAGSVALSATILVLLFVVALAGAFLSPARSLIDLIARTFVRPR
jgi:hypothetical protein